MTKPLKDVLEDQKAQVRELLNRLQSKDLHAFATMQANTTKPSVSSDEIYPRSDEAEARKMVEMYGAIEGIGEVVYSDEEIDLLNDLGQPR